MLERDFISLVPLQIVIAIICDGRATLLLHEFFTNTIYISGDATLCSGCSQEHPELKLFFIYIYNNYYFFIYLPLKKNRNTLNQY